MAKNCLKAALRAANLIGDRLYGVDIKSRDNEHYVIDVNDNPGIDAGDEDHCLEDELYRRIMRVFLQRMQAKHGWHAMPHYDQSQMEGVVDNPRKSSCHRSEQPRCVEDTSFWRIFLRKQ